MGLSKSSPEEHARDPEVVLNFQTTSTPRRLLAALTKLFIMSSMSNFQLSKTSPVFQKLLPSISQVPEDPTVC